MGWILTIVLGIIGALVGGFLAGMLGMNANGGFTGLIFSVIGAIIVLFIYELQVTGQSLVSYEALELFQKLYVVEREIDERFEKNQTLTPRDASIVRQIRQAKAKPIADSLYRWLQEKRQLTSKNAGITKAIDYCLKRWMALSRYLDDGNLPIDNNWAENQMRPWALGRKNWLFAGSLRSGQRAAVIMSLVQSARLNGVDPYAYLTDVLKRLPTHKDKDIDELLPHVWQPPQ